MTSPVRPIQIPWALSATGIGYNIPGIKNGLHLNGAILAQIFTGKITSWGDKAITKLNSGLAKKLKKPRARSRRSSARMAPATLTPSSTT